MGRGWRVDLSDGCFILVLKELVRILRRYPPGYGNNDRKLSLPAVGGPSTVARIGLPREECCWTLLFCDTVGMLILQGRQGGNIMHIPYPADWAVLMANSWFEIFRPVNILSDGMFDPFKLLNDKCNQRHCINEWFGPVYILSSISLIHWRPDGLFHVNPLTESLSKFGRPPILGAEANSFSCDRSGVIQRRTMNPCV